MKPKIILLFSVALAVCLALSSCTDLHQSRYGSSSWQGESERESGIIEVCSLTFSENAQQCDATWGAKAPAVGFGWGQYEVRWISRNQFSLLLVSGDVYLDELAGKISGNKMKLWIPGADPEFAEMTTYELKRTD